MFNILVKGLFWPGMVARLCNFSTLGDWGRGGLLEARPRVQDQPGQHSKTLSLKIYFGVCPSSLSWNYINLCNMYIIYSTYSILYLFMMMIWCVATWREHKEKIGNIYSYTQNINWTLCKNCLVFPVRTLE